MAADQRALASIEINMNDIPEGQTKTYEWRGKPVFVKHRTATEIARCVFWMKLLGFFIGPLTVAFLLLSLLNKVQSRHFNSEIVFSQ